MFQIARVLACLVLGAQPIRASTITGFYGDADGFGIGATTTIDPLVSHASGGDAPLTDVQLIGDLCGCVAPAFAPTGSFDAFTIPNGETITAVTITMSAGAWDVGTKPVDGANTLVLDGLAVPTSFFALFTANNGIEPPNGNGDAIETQTLALSPAFFPLMADGLVSLNGTHLSEEDGSGSFQIDYLRLDIETQASGSVPPPPSVPEPTTIALLGTGLIAIAGRVHRRPA
jgi:hypothetical protein